jgi:NAD(P)H-hydrate epimerase
MVKMSSPLTVTSIQSVPAVTTEQMREVDRAMIRDFGISLVRMMENAGRNLAELTRIMLGGSVEQQTIVVLAGQGNNGGGGMVAARHLANWGAYVKVILSHPPAEQKTVAHEQLEILRRMGLGVFPGEAPGVALDHPDLILDALIGYGLVGPPRGITADLIRAANASDQAILALDSPSGLDTGSGEIFEPCICANATLTLALPKTGLLKPEARRVVGELYLADIGVPPQLYAQMGIRTPNLFGKASLVRLDD